MILAELNLSELRRILSDREIEVVRKRLQNKHITQTESNYLSRSIRPKLKAAQMATSLRLLSLLDYRRKKYERENKIIKNKILDSSRNLGIRDIRTIILYGSYVQNRHTNYRDIDVLIVLDKKLWKTSAEKYRLEKNMEKNAGLNIDVNLVSYKDLMKTFPHSPLLQTELEDYELIYGDIKLNKKRIINKRYLYVKLLEIEPILELGKDIESRYIYNALRTCLSIELFLKKVVTNRLITDRIIENLGSLTTKCLIENNANSIQKEIALRYLAYLYKNLEKKLKWAKRNK